jgi:hypothetical protein
LIHASQVAINSGAVISALGGPGGAGLEYDYCGGGGGGGFMAGPGGTNGAGGSVVFAQSDLVPAGLVLGASLSRAKQVLLSWPVSATNYVVETSGALAPVVSRSPVTNAVGIVGNTRVVTNSLNSGPAFFRLRSGQ